MAIRIKRGLSHSLIIQQIQKISGVNLGTCYQCKKCACGCPVSPHSAAPPSEIIRRLQLGEGDKIFDKDIIWVCTSCATCFARCPMEIDMAAVMDALRMIAVQKRAATPKGNAPFFNKIFLNTVWLFGRVYDLGMIAAYKIRTLTYKNDMDKFPDMLKKRKIAFLPPHGAKKSATRHIFNRISFKKGN